MKSLHFPIAGLLAACLLCSADDTVAPSSNTSPAIISILFDAQPIENGITFDRTHAQAAPVSLHGTTINAWQALSGSEPSSPNLRSFRFKITDPRFQGGAMPVVDVEFTYYTTGPMGIEAKADTVRGAQVIGGGRGRNTDFLTVTYPLQDAFFGRRQIPNETKPVLNGSDLLLNTHNGDLYLRSIRVIGYDRKNDVDWSHMLRIGDVASGGPGGVLLFPRTQPAQLKITLMNDALVDRPVRYQFQITDYRDRVLTHSASALTLHPGGTDLSPSFDPKDWPLGPYEAKLDVYLDDKTETPLLSRTMDLGVIDAAQLDKARPGEFLFGLDPANGSQFYTHTPLAFAYYRLMGVDLLRDLWEKDMPMTADSAGVELADLAKENLQAAIIIVPPSDKNPDTLARSMAKVTANLTDLAKRYAGNGPGKLHFFELGNEPDLHFFYPRPMADYATAFYAMRQAIKDGAAQAGLSDKDTLVYNGGLAFVHPEGLMHSRQFLALLDPTKIDAIAYHGHGPGIGAERNAWERVHTELIKDNKAGLVQLETESGLMASDREGSLTQARTVVGKMVYAESKGEPTLMFFRLFMGGGESAYSMTENLVEPRPSVLSYRAMVERLRHFRFIKTLDFSDKSKIDDADGFLFAEQDASGAWTGRKVAVAFCEKPHQADVRVKMASPETDCPNITLYDMFGNAGSIDNVIGNVAPLALGPDPVYLAWSSSNPPDSVDAAASPIQVASLDPLLEGASTDARFAITNPLPQPVEATLAIESTARIPLQASPAKKDFSLAPNQSVTVPITLMAGESSQPLGLPKYWRVFLDADPASASALTFIPLTLPGRDAPVTARSAWSPGNQIDFAQLAGSLAEKRPAIACAYLDSPADTNLNCSASADWWMAWYVNGQKVCDTLAEGNQSTNHLFTLPLKAGRNLIVVEVLAGKLGWQLNYSGPKELATASGHAPDRLDLTLSAKGTTLAQQTFPLDLEAPLLQLGPKESPNQLETWLPLEPLTVLGSNDVKNLWFQEPDQSRWYKGEKDLSATAWMRENGKSLQLYIVVNDDKLVQAATPADLLKNDSLRVVMSDENAKSLLDLTCGLIANQTASIGNLAGATCSVQRKEDTAQTLYLVTIPKKLVGTNPFRLDFSIADNDEGYLKQTIECGDVVTLREGIRLKCHK